MLAPAVGSFSDDYPAMGEAATLPDASAAKDIGGQGGDDGGK